MESLPQIDARIRKTFSVLEKVAKGIADGHIRSAIVSGATGCGKSYTLESVLKDAEATGKISYSSVRGAISAITLYQELWNSRGPGDVQIGRAHV